MSQVDIFIQERVSATRLTLVLYSKDVLKRLQHIEVQFRNAAFLLAKLLSVEDVSAALCGTSQPLLGS